MADICQYVIGVDTHAATHHYAVIHPGTGAVLDDQQFPTTPAGLRRAADWISRRTVTINMLTALLHATALGTDARHALTIAQLGQVATWRPRYEPLDMTILRELATEYAQDILVLDQQRAANKKQIRQIVRRYSGAHPALVRGSRQR